MMGKLLGANPRRHIKEELRRFKQLMEAVDVPVLQRLLAEDRLVGRRIRGRFLDLGLPEGYAEADRLLRGEGQRVNGPRVQGGG